MTATKAMRFNTGKLQLSMVPASLSAYAAAAFMYGADKYARDNWRQGFEWTSLIDSLRRHLDAFEAGENYDDESQLNHLAHVAANVAFLIEHVEQSLGKDNRYVLQKTSYDLLHRVSPAVTYVVPGGAGSPPVNDNGPVAGNSSPSGGVRS